MIYIEKLHLFSTVFMVGAIWLVQVVQYPAFLLVPEESFKTYHAKHSDRISYIVAPAMLLELICAYWLFYEFGAKNLVYLLIIATIFLVTAFVSVPLHNKLVAGKDELIIKKLILTNWIRTVLWSIKLVILFAS